MYIRLLPMLSTAGPPKNVLPTASHPGDHYARVRDEVARTVAEVPLYAGRAAPPTSSDPEAVAAWLAAMPIVGKRELRRGFPKALVRAGLDLKAEMARGAVEIVSTSGTTENRLQVLWENAWWDPQEREGMRLNRRVAEVMPAGGSSFSEAVLTTPVCGGATCHVGNLSRGERTIDGMLFLNQVADPTHWGPTELERMLAEWNDFAADGVEADPAYLGALCRHARARGVTLHTPKFITLTYELATRGHLRAARERMDTPLYPLYGATETGVLFMSCTEGRLHHNARHSHIELLDAGGGLARVLVTTLGRTWMPLVRYELGDLVRLAQGGCGCGLPTDGYLLERVEGRTADAIEAETGVLTPAALDDAVDAADPDIFAWQLQRDGAEFQLRHVSDGDGRAAADALAALVGAPVKPTRESAILPEASGKYRLVRPS
jgi:phenylacetate-CoA ligase